jgi:arginyl-tRNA synthetase
MLDTKGNTVVYLLYASARLESICVKAKKDFNVDVDVLMVNKTPIIITHPSERNLVLQLQMFTDTLAQTLQDLYPCHICEYLYNLSIAASNFCSQFKILGRPEMNGFEERKERINPASCTMFISIDDYNKRELGWVCLRLVLLVRSTII